MAATTDGNVKPLQIAMRLVKTAIQLDSGNRHKEAYCEYLRSVNYISHVLLEDASSKQDEMGSMEVEKMIKLAEQCLERIKSFTAKQKEPPPLSYTSLPDQTTSSSLPPVVANTTPAAPEKTDIELDVHSRPNARIRLKHRRVLSEGEGTASPFLPPEIFQRLQTVENPDKKELTPIEEASRLNEKLKANYEARMARLTPGQATQKTSLTLSLQRQMMENLIIAKARQDARKMEERRLRLQEEANRRFASSSIMSAEDREQRLLYANILEYEQDHDWPKMWKANLKKNPEDPALVSGLVNYMLSCPDHPVVMLLHRLQYRTYNRLYPIISRYAPPSPMAGYGTPIKPSRSAHSLLLHPDSSHGSTPGVVHSLSDMSLSVSLSHDHSTHDHSSHDHSTHYEETDGDEPHGHTAPDRENSFEDLEQFLTQLDWGQSTDLDLTSDPVHGEVDSQIQDQEERALKEHLKTIVKDIHNTIDRLLSLCLLSFECLNTASAKDICVASIEEAFFTPLWSPLLALFRKVYHERELAFEISARLYRDASPGDIGVPSKLFHSNQSVLNGAYAYEPAVQELKMLCRDCCPQRKLECIVRTLRLICACAEDYRSLHEENSPPKTAAIGADDLLPILSFVALRTELPQLVSECAALEEFIHEGYLIGEEGYCLTSLQSALTYIESLHTLTTPLPNTKLT
ncbi:VPS9 domain-containing protein 1 isoform X2 [Alosa pseudoharengus]|uniref:VPS9 domain-containing protein 1 isoform X2 n=1 Tax=Alosa pseudoharengus TaxID=34774 RepID=UPI003F88715C